MIEGYTTAFRKIVALGRKTVKIASVTVIESIIKDLEGLPKAKLVEAAGMIYRLNQEAQQERAKGLQRLFGVLSQEDGEVFEEALHSARASK